jgi:hypothetical protein
MRTNTTIQTIPEQFLSAPLERETTCRDTVQILAAARFAAAVRCDVNLHALWRWNPREFGCETTTITPESHPTVELQLHGPLLLRIRDESTRIHLNLHRSAAIDAMPAIQSNWSFMPSRNTSRLLRNFEGLRASISSAAPRALCRQIQIELEQMADATSLATPIFSVSIPRTPQTQSLIESCLRGEFDALWFASVYAEVVESGPIAAILNKLRTIPVQVSYLDRTEWKRSVEFFQSASASVTSTGEVVVTSPRFSPHDSLEDSMILASQERRQRNASAFPVRADIKLAFDQLPFFVNESLRVRAEAFAAAEPATSRDEIECEYSASIPRHALEVWFCAPLERGRSFTSLYTALSKGLQQIMRDWLPAFWTKPATTFARRMTALTARLYGASRPFIGTATADMVPDWMSDEAADYMWKSGTPEFRLRIVEEKLHTMRTAHQAELYARRQVEMLSDWVYKDRLLPALIQKEASLIESFINFGVTCRTLEKSGDIADAVLVRQAIVKKMEPPRRILRKFFMRVDYEILFPLLFIHATNLLNAVLKRDYVVTTTLTLRAPSGSTKKFCSQTANFPAPGAL